MPNPRTILRARAMIVRSKPQADDDPIGRAVAVFAIIGIGTAAFVSGYIGYSLFVQLFRG